MTSPREDYLRRLESGLGALPRAESKRILDEIRTHLAERGDDAIVGLGPADRLAEGFAEDYRIAYAASPVNVVQAAVAGTVRRLVGVTMGLVAVTLYFVTLGLAAAGILEVFYPSDVDFAETGFGIVANIDGPPQPGSIDFILILFTVVLGVMTFLVANFLMREAGRRLLRRA